MRDPIRIYIAGLESSGNHWVRSVLAQSPEISIVGAQSFPSGYRPVRNYPWPDVEYDVLVVVARDGNCQRRSVNRMKYNDGYDGRFTHEESMLVMRSLIVRSRKRVFVSYETALLYRQVYWNTVFGDIGVEPVMVATDYLDGNVKYISP